jgi:hypothetical protein
MTIKSGDTITADEWVKRGPLALPVSRVQHEARFQAQVLELAKAYNWAAYHTWNSQHSAQGFPDLELSRCDPHRIIKAELKHTGRKPTTEQVAWLNLYSRIGHPIEPYLWYPSHLDAIAEILKPEWKPNDADPLVSGLWTIHHQQVTVYRMPAQARRQARRSSRNANSTRPR